MKTANIDKILSGIKTRHTKMVKELAELVKEKKTLEKAGVEFGTPNWKSQITKKDGSRKEYLRIIYPGGTRKYIGCKEDKVQFAMECIKRGERVQILNREISSLEFEINSLVDEVRYI